MNYAYLNNDCRLNGFCNRRLLPHLQNGNDSASIHQSEDSSQMIGRWTNSRGDTDEHTPEKGRDTINDRII